MSFRRLTAGLLTAGLALTAVAAEDDGATVAISDVTVTVDGSTVSVTGSVAFDGTVEFAAFEDATGDSSMPGAGFDMSGGTIIQDGKSIVFRMNLDDAVLGDVQPGALYNWNIGVSGAEEQRLFAWRNDALNGSPGEWSFTITTFGDDGFSSSPIPGSFTGDAVEWHVDAAQIAGKPGARIGMGAGPITASQGGGGALQLTELVDYDTAEWNADGAFTIGGGASLTLENDTEEFTSTTKTRKDVFTGSFEDVPSGTYTLTITSAFGSLEVVETRTVKVA